MSNSVTEENEQLLLLDILGFPSENILFNPLSKNLIYSLGSNIISYNLITNTKTFVQYLPNEIILLKFLDKSKKLLSTIDNSPFPLLCIWELPSFNKIYSKTITISSEKNYNLSNIFLEQIYQEVYLIIITSNIGINYLYILKTQNELNNNYDLELFGKLSYIKEIIYGFKAFYNSKDIIFLLEKNVLYYNLDLDKENCYEKMKINFPFSLINNSLRINRDFNIIAFLTTKGNCLIYDQNGNNKPSINPFEQEYFTACEFEGNSICLGTNNGKIYVYNIYDNKPKFFIHYRAILRIKNNFQLNNINKKENIKKINNNTYDDKIGNCAPAVKYIYLNEKINEIFLFLDDNSILLAPLNILIDDLNYQNSEYSEFSEKDNLIFYAFNHSKNIDDIIINYSPNYYNNEYENDNKNYENNNNDLVIFSCSKDQKIIKTFIDYETNKLSNSFFNLKEILNNNKSHGTIINNNVNNKSINKNINDNMIYLTVLKYHPLFNNKLFAGDNKGFLYLFDSIENKFQYKKSIIGIYEITFLEFSKDGQILCIGFDTGCMLFCDMRKDCKICLELNNHYMPVEESEFRKINNQIICFSYFFKNKNRHNNCLLYMKNTYLLEYCELFYDRNKLNKKEKKIIKVMNQIVDIKIHISENYVIILNNTNHIIINHILTGEITAAIDLNSLVHNSNNIQMDESGLFLGVICELNNNKKNNIINSSKVNKNKRNYIIIFEIGTGKVKTCINYINPISKIIFDKIGNYLIIAGEKGEITLWKLCESMSYNIKYVLEEMKLNNNFWDEYEIKYDNNYDFKNEIVNNSDYAINNRETKNMSNDNSYNQIKDDIKFDKKNYNQDLKNSISSNNINYSHSNSNITSNYFRKNNNKSEKENEYEKKHNITYRNRDNYLNQSENSYSKYYYNKTYNGENPKNYNKNSNIAKRSPLLIDSKKLLKGKKEKNITNNKEINNDANDKDNNYYMKKKYKSLNKNHESNYNNIKKEDINKSNINKDNDFEFIINNSNYKKNINNTMNSKKNNYNLTNKDEDINGMAFNYNLKNNKNTINTSSVNNYKNISKSMRNINFNSNAYSQTIPKLKHINLFNKNNVNKNKISRTQSTNENYNFPFPLLSSKGKTEEERKKNIKDAINTLLFNYSPNINFEKQKNIQLTINSKNDIKNINNIDNNNNKNVNEINEDFIMINNKKINIKKNNNNINSNKFNLIQQKIKKYPEPDNIDDNLINSIIEPIPHLEEQNESQKIDMDDESSQFGENNNNSINNNKMFMSKNNNKVLNSTKNFYDENQYNKIINKD